MAAHQAPPSLGFSRQEHWSGLPFPSPFSSPHAVLDLFYLLPTLLHPPPHPTIATPHRFHPPLCPGGLTPVADRIRPPCLLGWGWAQQIEGTGRRLEGAEWVELGCVFSSSLSSRSARAVCLHRRFPVPSSYSTVPPGSSHHSPYSPLRLQEMTAPCHCRSSSSSCWFPYVLPSP